MGIRKFFASINWVDHTINFIVVIVGVTIAFYLSNQKEVIERRELERNSLESIVTDLDYDIEFLTHSTDTLNLLKRKLSGFVNVLSAGLASRDSLFQYISIYYVQIPFLPADNTYQSLVTSGNLDVIRDFELRKGITELYHRDYEAIHVVDQLSSLQKNSLVLPYLMTLDHGRVQNINMNDPRFFNVSMFSLYYLVQKHQYDSMALQHAKDLKSRISQKIETL
ncbi:MAG: hypothetical protein RLN86_01890 [Cyclobacteriaceae bacterium]